MDRAEQAGLGVAIIGHVAVFVALSVSLLSKTERATPINPPMAVELIAETAAVSSAPDAVLDASPPPVATEPEVAPLPPIAVVPPPKLKIDRVQPKPKPVAPIQTPKKPIVKPTLPAASKPQSKLNLSMRDLSSAAQQEATRATERAGTGKGQGKSGSGTPAVKTAAEVRRDIRVSLAAEILPYWKRCVPDGVDIALMETQLDLRINPDGSLAGVSNVAQTGVNDSNRAQQQRHKECAIKAAQLASPFKLDPASHDVWKLWPMAFKATERK